MTTPQVLGERYEIGGVLGRGGMAEVHRGRDLRLGREVAVKVLRSDLARDPSFQVRFRREAQAAASLNHPAIVAVYDTGEDRGPTGNTPYIVMEYVEGETLRDVLRREGVLPPERAMSLAADICGALDFSHRNGIVHRDVKPGNVMITPAGSVKVMDFGIARAVSDSAATMTSTAAVIGTAQYLSPEQARGEGVDARSDVYSLGCLLYELVTGAPPFTGDSPVSVAYQHVREDPRLPSSINPAISPELDSILLKAMSKNPANRYQSAAEMRNDLLRALAGQRVEATPVMGEAERTAVIGVVPPATGRGRDDWDDDDEAARRKRNRIIAAVVGALVLIGAIVGIAIAMSGGNDEDPPAAAATVTVPPSLVGMQQADAEAAITGAGLVVGDVTQQEVQDESQVGTVLDTQPGSGAEVDEGSEVDLTVGQAPDTITVPSVVGLSADRAQAALEDQGFTRINTVEVDSLEDEGQVIAVDPEEGAAVAPTTAIRLSVSNGTLPVPAVAGQTQDAATQALRGPGFTNITVEEVEDPAAAGTVLGTTPAAGTPATAATEIVLRVSQGPAQPTTVAVPSIAANTAGDQAYARLQNAGFTNIAIVDPAGNEASPDAAARFVRTDPPAGTQADPDERLVLIVQPATTPGGNGNGNGNNN